MTVKEKSLNVVTGDTACEINVLLSIYEQVKAKENRLAIIKKEVTDRLKELTEYGMNETDKYMFKKVDNKGRLSISVKDFSEQAPELFGKVSSLGLVKMGDNYATFTGIKQTTQKQATDEEVRYGRRYTRRLLKDLCLNKRVKIS